MIKYEDLGLPCLTIATINNPTDSIRTQFDYGIRQRKGKMGLPTMNFRIILKNLTEKEKFGMFWGNLKQGVQPFLLDQPFGLYLNKNKKVRFISGYQVQELGGGLVEISSMIELYDPISDALTSCTLVPSTDLQPNDRLYPNKCPEND